MVPGSAPEAASIESMTTNTGALSCITTSPQETDPATSAPAATRVTIERCIARISLCSLSTGPSS